MGRMSARDTLLTGPLSTGGNVVGVKSLLLASRQRGQFWRRCSVNFGLEILGDGGTRGPIYLDGSAWETHLRKRDNPLCTDVLL